MGRGEGFCGSCCTCIYNVLRSIPFMSIIGCALFAAGFMAVVTTSETVFDGLKHSGFDLTSFQAFVIIGMFAIACVNSFILLVSFFTTGWCMEKCCHKDKHDGMCVRCCQCFFGIFTQYIFYILAVGSVLIFFVMTIVCCTASIMAVLEKSSCDTDAFVAIKGGTPAEVSAGQYAAGSWIQMVANMPLDDIPLLNKAESDASDPLSFKRAASEWQPAKDLGTRMCCGGTKDLKLPIDAACAFGTCTATEKGAEAECGAITLVWDKDTMAMKKKWSAACNSNDKCYIEWGFISLFMRSAFTMFVGSALCLFGQIVQLQHVQKSLCEVSAEQDKAEDDAAEPLTGGQSINYTGTPMATKA